MESGGCDLQRMLRGGRLAEATGLFVTLQKDKFPRLSWPQWSLLEYFGKVDYSPSMEVGSYGKLYSQPRDWVREQVELYESSGGTEGTTLRDTGLPVIIVTHIGNKTGAIRKTPLMRVKDGNSYVLVGSQGGAPTDPVWVHNLRVNPDVNIRDETVVRPMRVREVEDEAERSRLWKLAIAAYPPYAEYQERTTRRIPVFIAERS
jgi:deazaflavin-dependent oxidoreductase (nitroreductase family)